MPKQTFLNLSEEKRHSIVNAAADEFANLALRAHPSIASWPTAESRKAVSINISKTRWMFSDI